MPGKLCKREVNGRMGKGHVLLIRLLMGEDCEILVVAG